MQVDINTLRSIMEEFSKENDSIGVAMAIPDFVCFSNGISLSVPKKIVRNSKKIDKLEDGIRIQKHYKHDTTELEKELVDIKRKNKEYIKSFTGYLANILASNFEGIFVEEADKKWERESRAMCDSEDQLWSDFTNHLERLCKRHHRLLDFVQTPYETADSMKTRDHIAAAKSIIITEN